MAEPIDIRELNARIESQTGFLTDLRTGMATTIVGQKHLVDSLLIGLLADGHILLEGVPGLAKTLAIKTLASLVDAEFSRIQFTPDLLPADVVGTVIYSPRTEKFAVKRGPVFAHFVLADEINRAPAKVQSALLEAAQVDRFMMKVIISYPSLDEEKKIVRQQLGSERPEVKPVVTTADIIRARGVVKEVYLDERIEQYIADIVFATRYPEQYKMGELTKYIGFGGSPRASICLALAARACAFLARRGYVVPEDVRAVAHDVLRHRIGLTYEAEAAGVNAEARWKRTSCWNECAASKSRRAP